MMEDLIELPNTALVPDEPVDGALDTALARYTESTDCRLLAELITLYRADLVSSALDERVARYLRIRGEVAARRAPVNVLHPFWVTETHRQIVSGAALDFLMYRPVAKPGSIAGIAELVDWVNSDRLANRGAALAAVVLTGDRRVTQYLSECHVDVDSEMLTELAMTQSGVLFVPVVDIYCRWLETAAREGESLHVSLLAGGLANMVRCSSGEHVFVIERNFGLCDTGSAVRVVERIRFGKFRDQLLQTLERLRLDYGHAESLNPAINAWRDKHAPS